MLEAKREALIKEQLEKERLENAITSFRGEFDFLSNFYHCKINFDGFIYQNSESAFQAQKDLNRRIEFTNLSGASSKRLGKRVILRKDWEEVKLGIMEEILKCKFNQNPDLKKKLINTGDRLLIEGNDWRDTYWGVYNGKGHNNLGKLLMKIREEIKKSNTQIDLDKLKKLKNKYGE